jgi:hypothetical protein
LFRESIYYIAAVFAVVVLFFTMVPVWSGFVSAVTPTGKSLISDSQFLNVFNSLPSNMGFLIQYSFIAILLGLTIWIFLVPFRQEPTSYYE